MEKFIFITGGARSGKSRYAQLLAKRIGEKVCFIATCDPKDAEMKKRIALHKKSRPRNWKTIENPERLKDLLPRLSTKFDVVIIDCLGLLISKFLSNGLKEKKIRKDIEQISKFLSKSKFHAIVVSNETGCGIVPDNPLARKFRDILGLSNQIMAKKADVVYMMQAGIAVRIR